MKPFTVIGYWNSTGEPLVDWVEANDAAHACKVLCQGTDNPEDLVIVCVLAGHQKDELGLDFTLTAPEVYPDNIGNPK
jgi:hypothetical protein